MQTFSMTACAKINLSLFVLGKRPDGYHDIESVMQTVDFGDTVTLSVLETNEIQLTTNASDLPVDEGNIAWRAAKLMQETFALSCGFSIHIEKRIPIAAGLAGGSTNAAAVMHLINKACNLGKTVEELAVIGVKLGADVPFCLYGKPALAEGIGERLTSVTGLNNCYIVLANPGVQVSTGMIYKALDGETNPQIGDSDALLAALKENDLPRAFLHMSNMMERVATAYCPAISELLVKLKKAGADHVMMSGSGATCFGIFLKEPSEQDVKTFLGDDFVAIAKPVA
ncbi:MAG: 4-(cytidine 5'-diphospho)-2-C-methyl-D-erythritol kinase [Ruminococcaceae bacterium]|nr:4-(cytidine 5'-diphospho)-2-C-methyl-D-erythritol kinase [Oscillospiraceae bacterium]